MWKRRKVRKINSSFLFKHGRRYFQMDFPNRLNCLHENEKVYLNDKCTQMGEKMGNSARLSFN